MSPEELQNRIAEVAEFAPPTEAEWIARVEAQPTAVIAGVISRSPIKLLSVNDFDRLASRRQAAQAILQARLSGELTAVALGLSSSINSYQGKAERQTTWMLRLTWAIAGLTLILVAGLVVQIWMASQPEVAPQAAASSRWVTSRSVTFAGLLLSFVGAGLLFAVGFVRKQIGNTIIRPGSVFQFCEDANHRDVPQAEWEPHLKRISAVASCMNRAGFGLITLGTLLQMVGLFL